MNDGFRRGLVLLAMAVALLPLVEFFDHRESYGSDPEFVSVITTAAVCLGFLLFRREIVFALRRLLFVHAAVREPTTFFCSALPLIQDRPPPIRAPIRI